MKTIVKAAIKYKDKIYTGFDHGKCFKKLDSEKHKNYVIENKYIKDGFITSDGDFVNRKEAMKIAEEADQLQYSIEHYNKQTLISEDLHIDWLIKQEKQIADLEAKLAEKEEINKLVNEQLEDMERSKLAWENKYFKLEKQLADKNKEIEYFKRQARRFNNEAQKYYEDAYCNDFHNQDKVSFAIKKLEKIKEWLEPKYFDNEQIIYLEKIIDNQIEELKKEMK